MSNISKKVGIVGTYGRIDGCSFLSTSSLLGRVGQNTGNLLFQYAVCNSIAEDKCVIGVDVKWDVAKVRESCRVVVVPSANFIREKIDFSGFVNFLEAVDLPLVFLGLGVQAKNYEKRKFELHSSVLRMLDLVRERSAVAGLRGQFTKQVLEEFGVTNTQVIGCPTNFLNSDSRLHEKLAAKWKRPIHSFMATGDEPWPQDVNKRDAERKMVEWVHNSSGLYIQQSVAPFIKYARKNNPYHSSDVEPHHEESLRKSLAPGMSLDEFRGFIATKLRVYYSVDQWLEDAARMDFSIGLRLHGNMAAWQSGTPAVWVYHDSRTRELAETMALPRISHVDFLKMNSIEGLRDSIDFDFEQYAVTRDELQKRYTNILVAAGIRCSKPIGEDVSGETIAGSLQSV